MEMNKNITIKMRRLLKKQDILMKRLSDQMSIEREGNKCFFEFMEDTLLNFENSEEKEDFSKKIMKLLMKVYVDKKSEHGCIEEKKINEISQNIVSAIQNQGKILSGKSRTVKFNPRILRIALAAWLDSPRGYQKMKKDSIKIMPSTRTLQRLQAKMKLNAGICPKVYGWIYDDLNLQEHKNESTFKVQILFDEMKLKSGIYFNCRDNSIIGFAESNDGKIFNLANELYDLMGLTNSHEDETECEYNIESLNEPASYVNVFRIRNAYGRNFNAKFF